MIRIAKRYKENGTYLVKNVYGELVLVPAKNYGTLPLQRPVEPGYLRRSLSFGNSSLHLERCDRLEALTIFLTSHVLLYIKLTVLLLLSTDGRYVLSNFVRI